MNETTAELQLRMVWPDRLLGVAPAVHVPAGYTLRTYRAGDEERFFEVMALASWPGWDGEKLRPWAARLLPDGWFMAVHAASDTIVATAMALRDSAEFGVPGGELGWVASDPAHAGKRLGAAVVAAVTGRFVAARMRAIHLYTEDYRLPALKTYLRLGYVPYLYAPGMAERWRAICAQIVLPFTPEVWKS